MIRRWYWIALAIVLAVGFAAILVVAIAQPTVETWTAVVTVAVPVVLVALEGARRLIRRRRRQ